jgi:hypothetical protein
MVLPLLEVVPSKTNGGAVFEGASFSTASFSTTAWLFDAAIDKSTPSQVFGGGSTHDFSRLHSDDRIVTDLLIALITRGFFNGSD